MKERHLHKSYVDIKRKKFSERKECDRDFSVNVDCLHLQKVRQIERSPFRKRLSLQREKCSPSIVLLSHLLSIGLRHVCDIEERCVRLLRGTRRNLLVQIGSASFHLYSFCIQRYYSYPSYAYFHISDLQDMLSFMFNQIKIK